MPEHQKQFQLGKNGLSDNFIKTLESYFKKNKSAKISVLKSAGHEKSSVKEYASEITTRLGENYGFRVIGFSIFIKKGRKPKK